MNDEPDLLATALRRALSAEAPPFTRQEILRMATLTAQAPVRHPRRWPLFGSLAAAALLVALVAVVVVPRHLELFSTKSTSTAPGSATVIPWTATPAPTLAANWMALQARPLNLPTLAPGTACPQGTPRTVSPEFGPALGPGPAYLVGAAGFKGAPDWYYDKALWVFDPDHHEDVLIRGHQLDGAHQVQFSGGLDQPSGGNNQPPIPQLRLPATLATVADSQWATWITYIRLEAPGCYGVQIDGRSYSEVIVFLVSG